MYLAVLFLILVVQSLFSLAIQAQTSQIHEVVLDNGLKVLLLENHKSPAVTLQV